MHWDTEIVVFQVCLKCVSCATCFKGRLVDKRSKTACPGQCMGKPASCAVLCLLASTSVLVGGNVVLVVFLVSKDAMLHIIVCGNGRMSGN